MRLCEEEEVGKNGVLDLSTVICEYKTFSQLCLLNPNPRTPK